MKAEKSLIPQLSEQPGLKPANRMLDNRLIFRLSRPCGKYRNFVILRQFPIRRVDHRFVIFRSLDRRFAVIRHDYAGYADVIMQGVHVRGYPACLLFVRESLNVRVTAVAENRDEEVGGYQFARVPVGDAGQGVPYPSEFCIILLETPPSPLKSPKIQGYATKIVLDNLVFHSIILL